MMADKALHPTLEQRRTMHLLLVSILSGYMALVVMGITLLLHANSALDNRPHLDSILSVGYMFLLLTAAVAGVIDVILSLDNTERHPGVRFRVLILVVAAFVLSQMFLVIVHVAKGQRYRMIFGQYQLRVLATAMEEYAADNSGLLPNASEWCDALLRKLHRLTPENFRNPADPNADCGFAFNTNLSGCSLNEIPADVVLLFQASGPRNLCGGEELFEEELDARRISGIGVIFKDKGFGVYSSWSGTAKLQNRKSPVSRSLRWSPPDKENTKNQEKVFPISETH